MLIHTNFLLIFEKYARKIVASSVDVKNLDSFCDMTLSISARMLFFNPFQVADLICVNHALRTAFLKKLYLLLTYPVLVNGNVGLV